jgi:hypothetical protein
MTPTALTRTEADERAHDRLAGLDRLMRQPGGLPAVPEPVPLHRRREDSDREGTQ